MEVHEEIMLVKRAQAGDREALAQLWDTITPKLFGYLVNVLKDRVLAEDMLQSTWLKALDKLSSFNHRGAPFSAWLFAIARNECKQHWRKTNREVPLDEVVHDTAHQSAKGNQEILVEQILAKLSESDREVIRLRYIADLSVRDMARVLHTNSVAVRVRLHRAINRAKNIVNT